MHSRGYSGYGYERVSSAEPESPTPTSPSPKKRRHTALLRGRCTLTGHGVQLKSYSSGDVEALVKRVNEEDVKVVSPVPILRYYRATVSVISQQMPEIRVNSEGNYAISMDFVLASVLLTVLLCFFGPIFVPVAVAVCIAFETDRRWQDWVVQPLLIGLATLPLYLLWTMAEVVQNKETLREFRNIDNSMLELCGPFLCYLIISLSFIADVCQRCIELGAGQMILDEMHEIREQRDFVLNTKTYVESSTEPASQDDLNSQLQELVFYMDRHVCALNHVRCGLLRQYPRKLTSEFMSAMMRMLVVPDDDSAPLLLQQRLQEAAPERMPPQWLAVFMICALVPAMLPTLHRWLNGDDHIFHPSMTECGVASAHTFS